MPRFPVAIARLVRWCGRILFVPYVIALRRRELRPENRKIFSTASAGKHPCGYEQQGINPMNRIAASRLFLDGTHREAVGAAVAGQRAHVLRVEVQVATAERRARNGRPIVAVAADAAQRA